MDEAQRYLGAEAHTTVRGGFILRQLDNLRASHIHENVDRRASSSGGCGRWINSNGLYLPFRYV
jgi:hypothetical protein